MSGNKRNLRPNVATPAPFGPDEWNFKDVPSGLEGNALQYELLRERCLAASGLTRDTIRAKWGWWPSPWLAGYRNLSPEDRRSFERNIAKNPCFSFWVGTAKDLHGQDVWRASCRERAQARGEWDDDTDDGGNSDETPPVLTFVGNLNLLAKREDILKAFGAWLNQQLPQRPDTRQRSKNHLQQLGAFRIARHVAGKSGLETFSFKVAIFLKARNLIKDAKGWKEYESQSSWCDAIRKSRDRILS